MSNPNHYDTLQVKAKASQSEIKQAYRQLVKRFHPDQNPDADSHDQMAQINHAYEILGNPEARERYDEALKAHSTSTRLPRRPTGQDADQQLFQWLNWVFVPVTELLDEILGSLDEQVDNLAADPFDDELMGAFQAYLGDCQESFERAQRLFRALPNPPSIAGTAAHLYHCLNQLGDGLEELEVFTLNYDDHHLHTGQELFRIAEGLYAEATDALASLRC
ncbi:J domain-containing protein [Leptolyngbya sp. FACHB-261]|uniref:J domain-containing protein n=1 Tax=Leptolyngbya sp. FACHB-261 TaxID=2692806 RepID=UPI001684D45C|nr:DnaJ domain-containing protein [Leptolyngbya sp. FACHB-261]MBD2099698.1 DnaJ domain-containing protein [Leptolyngbya sp. FACHB-261]